MQPITSQGNITDIITASVDTPQIIFKHSTSCAISSHAYSSVSDYIANSDMSPPVHMLTIQETGELKMHIANVLNVTHESPQLIIIDNRKVVDVLNHWDISEKNIRHTIESL